MRVHNEALRHELVAETLVTGDEQSRTGRGGSDQLEHSRRNDGTAGTASDEDDDPFGTKRILSTDLIDERFHGVYYFPDMVGRGTGKSRPANPGRRLNPSASTSPTPAASKGPFALSAKAHAPHGPGVQAMQRMVQFEQDRLNKLIENNQRLMKAQSQKREMVQRLERERKTKLARQRARELRQAGRALVCRELDARELRMRNEERQVLANQRMHDLLEQQSYARLAHHEDKALREIRQRARRELNLQDRLSDHAFYHKIKHELAMQYTSRVERERRVQVEQKLEEEDRRLQQLVERRAELRRQYLDEKCRIERVKAGLPPTNRNGAPVYATSFASSDFSADEIEDDPDLYARTRSATATRSPALHDGRHPNRPALASPASAYALRETFPADGTAKATSSYGSSNAVWQYSSTDLGATRVSLPRQYHAHAQPYPRLHQLSIQQQQHEHVDHPSVTLGPTQDQGDEVEQVSPRSPYYGPTALALYEPAVRAHIDGSSGPTHPRQEPQRRALANQLPPRPPRSPVQGRVAKDADVVKERASSEGQNDWFYLDAQGEVQGPFSDQRMRTWNERGLLPADLMIQANARAQHGFASLSTVFRDPSTAFQCATCD